MDNTTAPVSKDFHFACFTEANHRVRDLIDRQGYRCVAILSGQCTIILARGEGESVKITWG